MARSGSGIIISLNIFHKHGGGDKLQTSNSEHANIYKVIDKHRYGPHV
jgi:hypothetical protein